MNLDSYMEPPPIKIGPISTDAGALLHAALLRVWLTKYFGAPAEIYNFSYRMPLCEDLPEAHPDQDTKNGVFIWWHKCVPIKHKWQSNRQDKSGIGTIRMLDFDKSDEVFEEALEIIRTNSLGVYRIGEIQIDTVKKIIEEKSEIYNYDIPLQHLKTYSNLEKRYILDDAPDENSGITETAGEVEKYFSHRGRKYALTLEYEPAVFVKKGNLIEYTLKAPPGFFGMERDYKEGNAQ